MPQTRGLLGVTAERRHCTDEGRDGKVVRLAAASRRVNRADLQTLLLLSRMPRNHPALITY
jgi:hypothetical protein